jgi:hypothetical protein
MKVLIKAPCFLHRFISSSVLLATADVPVRVQSFEYEFRGVASQGVRCVKPTVRPNGDVIMNPMAKPRRNRAVPTDDAILRVQPRRALPYEFVLEGLAGTRYITRPMFGCLAVYIKEKIVLVLRDKPAAFSSNGVWLATTKDHHESLRNEFPNMRSIPALGSGLTGWQMLPSDAPDFEESALRACELILAGDPRIGKTPKGQRRGPKAAKRSS